jgi:Fic-DOC domain mobile mystery protein B
LRAVAIVIISFEIAIQAETAMFARSRDPVSESFARSLHRQMFGTVWKWAGKYRTSNKNLGVNSYEIQPALIGVLGNVRYWKEHKTYSPDEIAVRFHRDIVWIHPFPNGNGHWSRLMADLLVTRLGQPRFTWGGSRLRSPDDTRRAYIEALRAADNHDYGPLLRFARS